VEAHQEADDGRPSGALADLGRWERAGGYWEVIARGDKAMVVALLSCDGDTEMDRIVSTDPSLRDYIGRRTHRDDH
jgi:ketosteroid isomerase-like protein